MRQRLFNRAQQRNEDFNYVLTRYAIERLLYRLSRSACADSFILKGATLFEIWSNTPHRSTRDVDLLGSGDSAIEHIEELFRNVCAGQVEPDGLTSDPSSVRGMIIREDEAYDRVRIKLRADLGDAHIGVQVDVGFGDAVTPSPQNVELPTMLEFPPAVLKAYPPETVIAEKFEAMVSLGIANSRLKDFYDVAVLSRGKEFEGATLSEAIGATFRRRGTVIPTTPPLALTTEFASDIGKRRQWSAFVSKLGGSANGESFEITLGQLERFLMPPSVAAALRHSFTSHWAYETGWIDDR